MSNFLIRLGCVLALIGVSLLSAAADLLPVELWAWMHGVSDGSRYFRLVPAEGHRVIEFTVLGVGIALMAAGWVLRRKRNRGA